MSLWVEWRCPQCGKVSVQRSDMQSYCSPNIKHTRSSSWVRMKASPGAAVSEARRASLVDDYEPVRV